ncbi:MAG: GGDEF domain-containing protein [Gammaproteobacteria bacterium HGW-Gammaproteobacteria-10]|nr:MAG: GGDEF domain-containing protein [Gammaproteobacteria bacterium HGW-Gammaproteobacteria-10]
MKLFGKNSIRKKLMLMLLLTSSCALLLSAVGFAVNDWLSMRSAIFERLQAQAGVIGHNSIAALTFGDAESAEKTLASLKNEADIVSAVLFSSDGVIFAHFERDEHSIPPAFPAEETGRIDGNFFVVSPILLDGHQIGNILLISDLSHWEQRQTFHLIIALGVLLLSLSTALLLSSRLQRLVSEPILKLAETARRVSEGQDYGLRAEKISSDEIGTLVDDFNDMLRQVQLRDRELQKARDELEERIEARTLELTELTRQLEHQAYHDMLTGLANRITFDDHLKLAIDQARRHGQRLAVMFLDLDRFKTINDTLGHAVGDKLLMQVSQRLLACIRDCDTLARLGGDEFAVLLTQIRQGTDAAEVASKLIAAIAEPIPIEGYSLHITTSIGISLFPEDGDHAETIVKNADTAMYRSKDRGRNQFTFFSSDMNDRAVRRLALENKLRKAIAEGAFNIHYQPRRDTLNLEIVSVEALARWNDPEEGPIAPSEFIPLAEECGLIAAIDEWMLENACREMLACCTGGEADLRLAVNLSPAQFIREDLVEVISGILQRTGFPGDKLELEITESLFGPGSIDACKILEQLCTLGIELSIDDFGTAYSSLSRLKQLPLHTLKIDRSFVHDLGHDADDETLVRTIISMAHNLNLKVVAEGVETETQYDYVKQYGCDTVQGYLFGKPVPFHQLKELL